MPALTLWGEVELRMGVYLVLWAVAVLAASGVPGLLLGRRSAVGQFIATAATIAGAGLGIAGVAMVWSSGADSTLAMDWRLPWGRFSVGIDGITAVFLMPVFLVAALGSVYGEGYWKQAEHPENGRKLRLFYGLLAGGLAMVTLSRNAVLFLMAWEVMALSAYALVTTEDDEPAVAAAGWVYLVATHIATLCLVAMFGLMYKATGSFEMTAMQAGSMSAGLANAIFVLAVVGFGLKAGIMPLHVWLPGAHANAPSHVSAIMSGVLIKMGIYGIVRIAALLPYCPKWWGALLLALGVVSGVLGVVFATAQHDLKRLLAYCSIENIGIILMGLGLALLGRTYNQPAWVALGLAGALLHVWNHSLFKSLLFMGAGSIIHATHTRRIDVLGGLSKRMPRTAALFIIGSIAICGLPPLNGFVSELLIYLGLFSSAGVDGPGVIWAPLAAPALAMTGAMAVVCFVKLVGVGLLGEPRSKAAQEAHEPSAVMLAPMIVLAVCCLAIGLVPVIVGPALDRATRDWAGACGITPPPLSAVAPLKWMSVIGVALAVLLGGGYALLRWRIRRGALDVTGTWDCGYAAPTARMQYTGTSFSQMLAKLFGRVLRPQVTHAEIAGPFPQPTRFESEVNDPALDEGMAPAFRGAGWLLGQLRVLQQGRIQLYLLYILVIVVLLLCL